MSFNSILTKLIGPVYRPFRHESARLAQQYTRYYKKKNVMPNTILYEVRDGQSLTDSPKAIFEYLLTHDVEKKYTHIWTVVPSPELKIIQERYAQHANVHFVVRNSKEYLQWLAQAEYLINNATFQPFFIAKDDQTYINTWHGTPLKVMGYDMGGSPKEARNVVRNFYQMDYLLTPNQHTSEVFLNSYRLKDGISGKVLEGGYPRIDQTLLVNETALNELLASLNFEYDHSKKIVLYAPTWKGTALSNSRNDVAQIQAELEFLREQHGSQYNVLVKVHPFLYKTAKQSAGLTPYLIPDVVDTNELLGVVDILVTDYSSIFFDFLVTGRPIIFYTWDEDIYEQERGNYFPAAELPGPSCPTMIDVAMAIRDIERVQENYQGNYADYVARFVPYDDGNATERYVTEIFLKKPQADIKRYESQTDKKKIIFYPGGLVNNGITTSFINLISNLDYERYDVTCILGIDTTEAQYLNVKRLAPEVHLLYRFSDVTFTKTEEYWTNFFSLTGYLPKLKRFYPQKAYEREMRRALGKTTYDYAIDFSGYSLYWSKFVLAIPAPKKFVFLHSDMVADREREVNGKKIHRLNLKGMFSVYHLYDYLVSVTNNLKEINKENLKGYVASEKFTYSENTINPSEILAPQKAVIEEKTPIVKRGGMAYFNQTEIDMWPIKPVSEAGEGFRVIVTNHKEVRLLAEITLADQLYYKVCYDDIYFGWVLAEVVTLVSAFERPIEKEVDLLGKVLKPTDTDYIYSAPLGLPGAKVSSPVTILTNLVLQVNQSIQTSYGLFYLVHAQKQEIGWIKQESLTLFNFYSQSYGKAIGGYLSFKDKVKYRKYFKTLSQHFTSYEDVSYFAKLREPLELITEEMFPLEKAAKTQLEKDVIGKISLVAESQGKAYAHFESPTESGWLPQVKALPLEPGRVSVFRQRTVNYSAVASEQSLTAGEIIAYQSLANVSQEETLSVTEDTVFKLIAEAETTAEQQYYLIEVSETEKVWTLSESLEITERHGSFASDGRFVNFPSAAEINFVTLGRLSPEKNQDSLIKAFAKYRQGTETGKLYLIGEGPMRPLLTETISTLKLEDHVFLLGHIDQPFAFMKQCQYFVLTSEYEGQPLSILEALTLGLPVVSTDIPACRQVLGDGKYGLLTKTNDVDGIAQGLIDIQLEAKNFAPFDSDKHNQASIADFEKLLR